MGEPEAVSAEQLDDSPGRAIGHVPALDALRGIAALMVVAHHFGVAADFPGPTRSLLGRVVERGLYVGWAGVDLFFVLSGFLITTILLATRGQRGYTRRFYLRRLLRIFPLHYAALVLGLLVLPLAVPAWLSDKLLGSAREHQVWLWTYTVNLATVAGLPALAFGAFGHFWTLAIEEQYYLAWPWVVGWLERRRVLLTCALLCLFALLLRGWCLAWRLEGWAYYLTLCRMDALAFGGLIAVVAREEDQATLRRWRRRMLLSGGLVLLALLLLVNPFYPGDWRVGTLGHSAIALACGGVILRALDPTPSWWLTRRWLQGAGVYGYGIYVCHWPLFLLLLPWYQGLPPHGGKAPMFLALGLAGSYALGWISYHGFEKHFLRLKPRYPATSQATS